MAVPKSALEVQGELVLLRSFAVTDLPWLKRYLEDAEVIGLFHPHHAPNLGSAAAGGVLRRGRRRRAEEAARLPVIEWADLMGWFQAVRDDRRALLFAATTWTGHLLGYLLLYDLPEPSSEPDLERRDVTSGERKARLEFLFADRTLWARGYEQDALKTLQRYAFSSLGLTEIRLPFPPAWAERAPWLRAALEESGFHPAPAPALPGPGRDAEAAVWVARASQA
ncbi:MAG TPA: hypothetical protein GXX55_07375 [Firmicutes bacterium]|nr:hypothetical protein [Bacillota bacterium]